MSFALTTLPVSIWQWSWLFGGASLLMGGSALVHVLLHKKDPRSAAYWVALVALVPLVGAVLYFVLGINVIRRKGKFYREGIERFEQSGIRVLPDESEHVGLAQTLDRISRFAFAHGNQICLLRNGDEAMAPMLEAIRHAEKTISLATYIFEAQGIGNDFVQALGDAVDRGVEVRVIVDDAGTRYAWPPVAQKLTAKGVRVQHFMPLTRVWRLATMNLRNHRKIMIVDGKVGFTGGMNIREGNMLSRNPAHPTRDLHFRVEGPVLAQMQRVFAEDWAFCSGETLDSEAWFPLQAGVGGTSACGIPDGPDEDMEVMPVAFFAALGAAKKEVKILTPYFLPGPTLIWALNLCVYRGVKVTIVTPQKNNIPPVSWAARTLYPELLRGGCRIFESPPPFDHSKIFLIDGAWSFLGSTNWDPRSLRLNFEFNLACYDPELGDRLNAEFDGKMKECREITVDELNAASFAVRLRNGIARLFIPLL
jgi:cardiolipin synthase